MSQPAQLGGYPDGVCGEERQEGNHHGSHRGQHLDVEREGGELRATRKPHLHRAGLHGKAAVTGGHSRCGHSEKRSK